MAGNRAGTPGPFLGNTPKKGPGVPAARRAILIFLDGGNLYLGVSVRVQVRQSVYSCVILVQVCQFVCRCVEFFQLYHGHGNG